MIIDHFYDTTRKIHWYHLGFHNEPIYQTFYQWQRTVKLHYEYSDMPHDYFVFLHEANRLEMHIRFKDYISKQHANEIWLEDFIDHTKPVDTTTVDYTLMMDLQAAIQEEIDRERIETLRRFSDNLAGPGR